jgi:hypothetical protein
MIHRIGTFSFLGLAFALGFFAALGACGALCAPDDGCGEQACGAPAGTDCEEGCDLCGCLCHAPTALFGLPGEGCPLALCGAVHDTASCPSDGVPVSIVRPPA